MMSVSRWMTFPVVLFGPIAAAAEEPVSFPADKLEWINVNEGVDVARLWGDANVGAYGRFVRFAPGFDGPLHVHSNGYHAALVQGVVIEPEGGEEHPAGSYWFTPGDFPHVTKCVSDIPCIWYEHSEGKFDMTFIE